MQPHVRVLSTGGTIASTSGEDPGAGKTPEVSGEALVEELPEVREYATVDVEQVCQVSGFQMTAEEANAVADAVERAATDGVSGVVVTHGTDTMAETAYYLDQVVEAEVPVVLTGAQRPFDQLGTDGPANLATAVRAAADERFRTAGTYVAFDDELHAARRVVKAHTSALATFESPGSGPVAELTPDGFRLLGEPGRYSRPVPGGRLDPTLRVDLLTNALGIGGSQVERALASDAVDGFVLAGTGLGNATGELGGALESALGEGLPVVVTSRCHAGTTAGRYGGSGGAKTLLDAGAVRGGDLPAWKARLRLWLVLSAGEDGTAVRDAFEGIDSVD